MESAKLVNIVTPKFQKIVQGLMDNLRADQFPDAEEYKLALKYNALPLGFDLLAYVFITPNGEVIWEDYEGETGSSSDIQALIRLLVAQKRYPQLFEFIPNRSDESKTCPICNGAGVLENAREISTGKPGKCFICAGLGWVTDETFSEIQKNSK